MPIIKEELSHFRPWHASIHLTEIEPKWSEIPSDATEKLACFLETAMKDKSIGYVGIGESWIELICTEHSQNAKRKKSCLQENT